MKEKPLSERVDIGFRHRRMKKKSVEKTEKQEQEIPRWKEAGFKSQREYDEWLNEWYEDIKGGYI